MKTFRLFLLLITMVVFTACEVQMAPSEHWRRVFGTETDSDYYQGIAKKLVKKVTKVAREYDVNKVAILDFVDEEGKVPVLGEYMAARVIEEIARKKYFRVAQRGEVRDVLNRLNLRPARAYTHDEIMKLGEALNSQALVTGNLTDIGTDIDVHITLVDIVSGEVIASATEGMTRTRFAVEMLRQH